MQEYLNEAEVAMLQILYDVYMQDYNPDFHTRFIEHDDLRRWDEYMVQNILKSLYIRNYIACTAFDISAASEIRHFTLTEKALNIFNSPQET